MTSPFRGQALRPRAIELMKAGYTADQLHIRFTQEGEDPDEIRAVLTELVALQQQAAAMDPTRLRNEAKSMFLRGATVEQVVWHFTNVGIAEADARPEVARIFAHVRQMKPCQRCGTPSEQSDLTFDLSGFEICNNCNLQDEIGRSEARAVVTDLETFGGAGGIVMAMAQAQANNIGHTAVPFCATCRTRSGVHINALDPYTRSRVDHTAEWLCNVCWRKIA